MRGTAQASGPSGPESGKAAKNGRWRKALAAGAAVVAVAAVAFFLSSMGDGSSGTDSSSPEAVSKTMAPVPPGAKPSQEPTQEPVDAEESAEEQGSPANGATAPQEGSEPATDASLATRDRETAPAVPVVDGVAASDQAEVRVTGMEAVDGEARGIGEIAGPAVRFTVSVTNNTGAAIDLGSAVVMVESGDERLPATELSGPGAEPFPPAVEPGETVSGAFVFLIPVESRDQVFIYLNYSVDVPMAAFSGAVPKP